MFRVLSCFFALKKNAEEENVVADEPLKKSSPGSVREDDKVMENQPISVGKVGLHEEMRSPGNTDARDKISDERGLYVLFFLNAFSLHEIVKEC